MVLPYWVHRAYDNYVLEGADLRTELSLAQSIIDAYMACVIETQLVSNCARQSDLDFDLFPY